MRARADVGWVYLGSVVGEGELMTDEVRTPVNDCARRTDAGETLAFARRVRNCVASSFCAAEALERSDTTE